MKASFRRNRIRAALTVLAATLCAAMLVQSVTAQTGGEQAGQIEQDLRSLQSAAPATYTPAARVMSDLAVLDSSTNPAAFALEVLRRANALEQEAPAEPTSEQVAQLMSDLREVSSPDYQLWDTRYADAQVLDEDGAELADEDIVEAESTAEETPETEEPAAATDAPAEESAPTGDAVEMTPEEAQEIVAPAPREPAVSQEAIRDANSALSSALSEIQETGMLEPTVTSAATPSATPLAPAVLPHQEDKYTGNPLNRPVNLVFRDQELASIVALLASMADINVIAGTDIKGLTVTTDLRGVPLMQAMQTALRLNDLGIVEEEGIYYIVPYQDAVARQRVTEMLKLNNAEADKLKTVLVDLIAGTPEQSEINISANKEANILLISGPEKRIQDLASVARQLDISEPVLPTVTEAIKLNYSTPEEILSTIEKMITPEVGKVAADSRSRNIIITDQPVVVEQIRELITTLDAPVKEVMIDTMVVDVTLTDDADTGVDWLINAVRSQSRRDAATGTGIAKGNLQELGLGTDMASDASNLLNFAVLSSRLDWRGVIQAEIRSLNGKFVSNPVVFTVENKPATIEIVSEIPYRELTETGNGGSQTSTSFKDVGTRLTVTPRVTHDDHIIAEISANESSTSGEFQGIPIEDRRTIDTTMHMRDGETIFMGGLRKRSDNTNVRKVPLLGDVPVVNLLFRSTSQSELTQELLVFMTCKVIDKENRTLDDKQQTVLTDVQNLDMSVDAMQDVWRTSLHPKDMHDPMYKFRRSE
jgi:type II secretory pathway component GspD/PulD (secretin)